MTGVWPPLRSSMASPYLYWLHSRGDSSPRDTYGLGRRPALREPCRPSAPGCLELVRPGQSDFGCIIHAADRATIFDHSSAVEIFPTKCGIGAPTPSFQSRRGSTRRSGFHA